LVEYGDYLLPSLEVITDRVRGKLAEAYTAHGGAFLAVALETVFFEDRFGLSGRASRQEGISNTDRSAARQCQGDMALAR
jgi:hypothetical protein